MRERRRGEVGRGGDEAAVRREEAVARDPEIRSGAADEASSSKKVPATADSRMTPAPSSRGRATRHPWFRVDSSRPDGDGGQDGGRIDRAAFRESD
jgi:hypothetical protein